MGLTADLEEREMAWGKPFSVDELTFIEESFPQLSSATIAERLGRSERGVNRKIAELGLRDSHARASVPPQEASGAEQHGRLADLVELRGVLRNALLADIDPRALPKIAAEYRATIDEIARIEGDGEDGADGCDIGELLNVVPIQAAEGAPGQAVRA